MSNVTEEDLKLITRKLKLVKEAGYGKVIISIHDHQISYATIEIGEQIKMDLKT